MNEYVLVYPMAVMVLLTVLVLSRMVLGRFAAVRKGEVDVRFYKTFQGDDEPRIAAQYTRHFVNLFENPVLFYAACVVAMVTQQGTGTIVWLAWAYVICRALHALVHLGGNKIPPRMIAYGASWLVLLGMWGMLVFGVTTGS